MKRDNVELTSDFTATISADMKVAPSKRHHRVGRIAESTTKLTNRTVMTRDVMDMIPTGRNIKAIGIMIQGTTIAVGGGGRCRAMWRLGHLQRSIAVPRSATRSRRSRAASETICARTARTAASTGTTAASRRSAT